MHIRKLTVPIPRPPAKAQGQSDATVLFLLDVIIAGLDFVADLKSS